MFRKAKKDDELATEAAARLRAVVDAETAQQEAELHRMLSVARAETSAQLAQEHRRLAEERRDELVRAEQRVLTELSGRLIAAQKEIEGKLTAWAQDLERVREGLATQLARLEQRQRQLITDAEARFGAETGAALLRGRGAPHGSDAASHRDGAADPGGDHRGSRASSRPTRRSVGGRCTRSPTGSATVSASSTEQIDREQTESVRKITETFTDVERRLVEQVERSVAREAARLTEQAAVEFNSMIRTAREEAGRRLQRELDRSIEAFSHQAERLLGERLAQLGETGGNRIERRLENVTQLIERRQEEFVEALERRMAEIEAVVRERMESLASLAGRSPRE